MKLCKDVFLNQVCELNDEISVTLSVKANNEFNALFFSFDTDLNCGSFKTFCKALGLTQKKAKEIILEQITF